MYRITSYLPIADPTLIFFVVLLIILLAPIIMGKLRIPHIIGMVLAGVVIGHHGLDILERDASFELFGRVGLYYIMFLASLELDIDGLRKRLGRATLFGVLSFSIPLIIIVMALLQTLDCSLPTALLLGCIMSSNTLVAYPIVSRYGLQRHPAVTLSVGGTMISLLLALILLAGLVQSRATDADNLWWLWLLVRSAVYCLGLLWAIPRLTRWFLRSYSDAVMQFIFVMSVLFLSASLADLAGLEGIFGAFFAGLILNRYIPHLSPLMNKIEFIGNAIFIPYFLIGVGMLINIRLLFSIGTVMWLAPMLVILGTLGKALAAYLSCRVYRMPWLQGHLIGGLTSAHAAGAIAMVMVGMQLKDGDGAPIVNEDILNAVVVMILLSCIVSSVVTEWAARRTILHEKELPEDHFSTDNEKILIPVKYPDYAGHLVNLAIMMSNPKQCKGLVGLNVVYDDENVRKNQEEGRKLLELIAQQAASSDVRMDTQVRIAANIANGINHAFKEFHASEVIIGMHTHKEVSNRFWGQFHQSLFNGLNSQIIMARINQPLSTLRRIEVAVPSRAQYEPGFYRWLERLSRLSAHLECRIVFNGRKDTLQHINQFVRNNHSNIRVEYREMEHWNDMPRLASTIANDHLFVVVTARKGTVSYKNAQERLPEELTKYFSGKNLMIIFPDQYGEDKTDFMTFAEPQHHEDLSAYNYIGGWAMRRMNQTRWRRLQETVKEIIKRKTHKQ